MVADTPDALYNTNRAVIDPRPVIRSMLAAAAAGAATPFNPEETDMPLNADDKAWIRLAMQQEIAAQAGLTEANKAWVRLMVQQELAPVLTAIARADAGDDIDIAGLVNDMGERLDQTIVKQLGEQGVVLRAELLAGLPEAVAGASTDEVRQIIGQQFDEAFGSLQLGVIPTRVQ